MTFIRWVNIYWEPAMCQMLPGPVYQAEGSRGLPGACRGAAVPGCKTSPAGRPSRASANVRGERARAVTPDRRGSEFWLCLPGADGHRLLDLSSVGLSFFTVRKDNNLFYGAVARVKWNQGGRLTAPILSFSDNWPIFSQLLGYHLLFLH